MHIFLKTLLFLTAALLLACQENQPSAERVKPRTIVTTDGEVDDMDSFIRMLFYANEFELEGLVYSSSQWHYAGDGKGTTFISEMPGTARLYGERTDLRWVGTDWMEELIDKYALVYDNLSQHAEGYPTPEYLKSIIRVGNIEFEGEMEKVTEGSEFIKNILLDDEPGPVYLQIWGGTNTVARALKSIEEEYRETDEWEQIYRKISDKAMIYAILDQDATYRKYIAPNWPQVRVLYNADQFWSFAYAWHRVIPQEMQTYMDGDWFQENILTDHGPLAANYYTWGDGREIANDFDHKRWMPEETVKEGRQQYDFISEGDSPAFLFLIDVGLRTLEDPAYGGWAGRLVQSAQNPRRWEDGPTVTDYNPYTDTLDTAFPQTRWIADLQQDFAARADWSVMSYEEANHPPKVGLEHAEDLTALAGEEVQLSGTADDPDGDQLNFRWWQYAEADSYEGTVDIQNANKSQASLTVPEDAQAGDTIHLILEVKDKGTPTLTRYRRVIITVKV
jgi:hypothetical protein